MNRIQIADTTLCPQGNAYSFKEKLEIARQLLAIPAQYHTGHCTGEGVCALLCRLMGERLQTFSTGMHLEL